MVKPWSASASSATPTNAANTSISNAVSGHEPSGRNDISAAVDAAISAQRSLALPVRMGLATGEADASDGDYFGPVLNPTAQVMAAGHGGQVLVEGLTAALLNGVGMIDLGEHRLRDLAGTTHLFQVVADGL